jgi:tetratricopeptide (TPR) repeat protein
MLRRANYLMETGQYEQAYPPLKRLADGAMQHGMPVRAANLYLQAARARLQTGSAQDAADLARRAISLLARVGQVERVRRLLPRMVDDLEKRGYYDQAVALRAEITALLGSVDAAAPSPSQRGTLPAKCPSCNAPARADEVDWVDNSSAECVYCGSVIRTE